MSSDAVQRAFDKIAHASGFVKHKGAWYLRQQETIVVLELQRSEYGQQYYVNVGLWLRPLRDAETPSERSCHIRTRLEELLPDAYEAQVSELLDADNALDEQVRHESITRLFNEHLLRQFRLFATVDGLRETPEGQLLRERSLVHRSALPILAGG